MRPAWRLGINSLSGRLSRSILLAASVALSAALIATVACALESMQAGLRKRVDSTVGAADLRVGRAGKDVLPPGTLEKVRAWPEARLVVPRSQGPIVLKNPGNGNESATMGTGVDAALDAEIRPMEVVKGRRPTAVGEIAIDENAARDLAAGVGTELSVARWGEPITLGVVGIVRQAGIGLGVATRPESSVTLEQMGQITDKPGSIQDIDIVLRPGSNAEAISLLRRDELGPGVVVRTTAKITSGLDQSQRSGQIGLSIASALAMFAGAFIIMTGLTSNVTERTRELAMLRCIGGTRAQMAESQIAMGVVLGLFGALVGVPLGVLGAWILVSVYSTHFPAGFIINPVGVIGGVVSAILAGLVGSLLPAWKAARTSPLDALAARSKPATLRGIVLCMIIGTAFACVHAALFLTIKDPDRLLTADLFVGAPAFLSGYFLLAVPVLWAITGGLGGLISKILAIPSGLLVRSVQATPYRFGFTAGAMSLGLCLMIAIWTNGRAIDRDVLSGFKFPDAFAAGLNISERTQKKIADLPFVARTTPISVQNFQTSAFGLRMLNHSMTTFIAFEPDEFLSMARLKWIEGDPSAAVGALKKGGAVLVAKEFKITRGLGVGDTLTLMHEDKPLEFTIVGVVESPGLDVVSKYFEIGEDFLDMAVNAVFGSRADLERLTGSSTVRLIQIDLRSSGEYASLTDAEAIKQIRKAGGFEVLDAGSGRAIIAEIRQYVSASLYVFSLVGVGGMLVACFGVANLIVAGIQARKFEFGVLRAIGAHRGLIARMVLGEAVIIAVAACLVGTAMGVHAAWAGQVVHRLTLGMVLSVRIPLDATLMGWAILTTITIGAAMPAILSVNRAKPRELLGAVRG